MNKWIIGLIACAIIGVVLGVIGAALKVPQFVVSAIVGVVGGVVFIWVVRSKTM